MARVNSKARAPIVKTKPPVPSTRARALAARKAGVQRRPVDDEDVEVEVRSNVRPGDVLDRSRPRDIGTIHPSKNGAYFFQATADGEPRYFDNHGMRIRMPGDDEREAEAAARRKEKAKERAARLRAQADVVERGEEYETPDEDVEADGVNLTRWGLYGAQYRFAEVRRAILSRYNYSAPNEKAAIEFLIEQGVFTDEQYRAARRPAR